MRNIFIVLCFLISIPVTAQKIIRDEVDPYTNLHIRETSSELLTKSWKGTLWFSIKQADTSMALRFRMLLADVFTVIEGDKLIFLFEDSSTLELQSLTSTVGSPRGSGELWEANVAYKMREWELNKLKIGNVVGMRLNLGRDIVRFDDLKDKRSARIKAAALYF